MLKAEERTGFADSSGLTFANWFVFKLFIKTHGLQPTSDDCAQEPEVQVVWHSSRIPLRDALLWKPSFWDTLLWTCLIIGHCFKNALVWHSWALLWTLLHYACVRLLQKSQQCSQRAFCATLHARPPKPSISFETSVQDSYGFSCGVCVHLPSCDHSLFQVFLWNIPETHGADSVQKREKRTVLMAMDG